MHFVGQNLEWRTNQTVKIEAIPEIQKVVQDLDGRLPTGYSFILNTPLILFTSWGRFIVWSEALGFCITHARDSRHS